MPRAAIFTEGSAQIGMGHLTRCLSFAQAVSSFRAEVVFVVAGDSFAKEVVESYKFPVTIVESLNSLSQFPQGEIAFVDSYLADLSFYKKVAQRYEKKIYIDDYFRLDYPAGVILNYIPSLGIPEDYTNRPLLWGEKYHLLRKPFWNVAPKEIKGEVREVLVTFGGDDIRNLTPKVVKILLTHIKGLTINVVVGGGFKNKGELLKLAQSNPDRIKLCFNVSAEKMKRLMLSVDLAVSAGGQTLFELARVGVPTVAIGVAQNQENNLKGFSNLGFLETPFRWNEINFEEKLLEVFNRLMPYKVRKERSVLGREIIDGKGALRVAQFLIQGG
ncbi:MAG TPA: UDP-2,4-diacetamido-2,4,6-trideoxy-beta-L-altropyranose hydrolase [Aquifex aeolicus]|uniref:UDP-2,4-diacetamido-2,4, 6-trideoxy-beta-L-altropyranose hydrolase n=1 Tax=Aquifex aeolicus TaxID=63363 RepID=A0A9D1CG38_AQUAO|nr:UDP-2,4-diacetamido-2,4,6-trideoxy-beta-L-altropyranose hydrolase [Aquificales bacterium]HIP86540.1 UDP-2,4-diacetamido-2,4,6-trideoxy-beta-L-altropyranose hydrolase [Aquifex sp.]HIP98782.1 UDP-2,4-diacetamido-2,4,6-trideoxy-beta-L-altropyranose hydrolase [Aquifex aeolicus]HIQ25947.1 UDP-2,4-diacetamido-2,4,6-trideoxy-beta-L-altropyranose hydrolase [Aquifex aeolicus]